jgi:protein O-mannosyl-transferase
MRQRKRKGQPIETNALRGTPRRFWPIPVLAAVSFAVYLNSLSGDFIWDDQTQVLRNEQIRDFRNIPHAFATPVLAFANKAFQHSNYYRPLHTVGYMLAYAVGGISPWPYHLINLALHAITAIFVYLFCCEFRLSRFTSILAGLVFAVHPIHTEVVAWIAALPDAGCGAFYLISLWAYLRYVKVNKPSWLWLSAGAYLTALFFKEMAVTLPALVFVLMAYQQRLLNRRAKSVLFELSPYAIVAAVYVGIRMAVFGFIVTNHIEVKASFWDWISLGIDIFGQYIRYSLVPFPLSAFHLTPTHFSDRIAATILYGGLIVLVSVLVWSARKKIPAMPLCFAAFSLMLVPAFHFKGISLTFSAERYLYIPSFAVAVALALAIDCLNERSKLVLSGVLIALFTVITFQRNKDWSNNVTLYNSTLKVEPDAVVFRINLAEAYLTNNQDGQAKYHLEQALASLQNPVYYQPANEHARVYLNLAAVAARANQFPIAKQYAEEALKIDPESAAAYVYLGGVIMESDKNYNVAMNYFNKAMELDPLNEVAFDYMGSALFNLARYREAAQYFQQALNINPGNKEVLQHVNMVREKLKTHL